MRLREFANCEVSDAARLVRHTVLMRPKVGNGAYHAVYAAEELARLHRKDTSPRQLRTLCCNGGSVDTKNKDLRGALANLTWDIGCWIGELIWPLPQLS